jgi:phage tail protein X
MKALFSRKKTGRILAIAAKVQEKNPGLSPSQSFTLARKGIEVQKKAEESN